MIDHSSVCFLRSKPGPGASMSTRGARWFTALSAVVLSSWAVSGQEILLQESFEDDGNGTRYTVEGGEVYEVDRIISELNNMDQVGPIYWARNSEVSFVGVPGPAPDRRVILHWQSDVPTDAVTEDFLAFFDNVAAWLLRNKENATVLFSPNSSGTGDQVLATRLTDAGHTVMDDETMPLPAEPVVDLVIRTSTGNANPSRFTTYPVPYLSYNGPDHDDELLSSIGQSVNMEMVDVTVVEGHPAVGDLSGASEFVTGAQNFNTIGELLPENSTILANYARILPYTVDSLAVADAVIAGEVPADTVDGTAESTDLVGIDQADGAFFDDWPVPGDPQGTFVTVATGKFDVPAAGTFSVALNADDGARLRIDIAGDGITADDDVVSLDGTGAIRAGYADVTFAEPGMYDFEWVSYNTSGDFGSEIAVAYDAGGGVREAISFDFWDVIWTTSDHIRISGMIDVTTYIPTVEPDRVESPFAVAIESGDDGGLVYGGGPFTNIDGESYFAGSGLNKFDTGTGTTKRILFNPVDVTGKTNLKLTIAAAATFLDFETSDFLDVYIDPDGDGPAEFQRLIHFTAPSGNDKFFDDVATNPTEPTKLTLRMQDVTYDIPDGATQLTIRVDGLTSWWNEIIAFDNIRVTSGAPAGTPTISIARVADKVVLTFTGGRLQAKADVDAAWADVAGAVSPFEVTPSEARQLYRAVGP